MSEMQITLNVDLDNKDHMAAVAVFAQALSGQGAKTLANDAPALEVVKTEVSDQKPAEEKVPKKRRTAKEVADDKAEKALLLEDAAIEESLKNGSGEEKALTIDDVRGLASEKMKTHKSDVIGRIKSYGAAKLTEVPQESYEDFVEFLNGLTVE